MPSSPGWLLRLGPAPLDATARFHELYRHPSRAEAPVLLVPGIFTDRYPWYLRRVRRALRARELPIDAQGTVRANAARIRDFVLRERVPVVLMGHSKGPSTSTPPFASIPRWSRRCEPNDGFVPFADAQIPGAHLVAIEGADHASLALPWLRPLARLDAGRAAAALVALALQ